MEEWIKVKLADCCESITDGDHMPPPKVADGVPFITISNIKSNQVDLSDTFYVTTDYYNSLDEKRRPRKGDILYTVVGTFGIPVLLRDNSRFVFQRHIAILRPNNKVDSRFLYYLLLNPSFYRIADQLAIGAVQRTIGLKALREQEVTIPTSIIEQRRIADILSSIDDKIILNNRINHNLEEQAQALYKSWFIDFQPFNKDLDGHPIGWSIISLSEIMGYSGGSQPPASEFVDKPLDGYVRFVQIRDFENDSHITYIPISKRNKLCNERDILIARYGASLGRICYGLNGAYNVALAKVSPSKPVYREFLRCYLSDQAFYEGINMKGNRAVQAGFNQSDIDSFRLWFPSDETILVSFENVCSSLFETRLSLKKENEALASLREYTLETLFNNHLMQ